jgi:hypothetical protein
LKTPGCGEISLWFVDCVLAIRVNAIAEVEFMLAPKRRANTYEE